MKFEINIPDEIIFKVAGIAHTVRTEVKSAFNTINESVQNEYANRNEYQQDARDALDDVLNAFNIFTEPEKTQETKTPEPVEPTKPDEKVYREDLQDYVDTLFGVDAVKESVNKLNQSDGAFSAESQKQGFNKIQQSELNDMLVNVFGINIGENEITNSEPVPTDAELTAERHTRAEEATKTFKRNEMLRRCRGLVQDISGIDKSASDSFKSAVDSIDIDDLVEYDDEMGLTDNNIITHIMYDSKEGTYFWYYIADKVTRIRS